MKSYFRFILITVFFSICMLYVLNQGNYNQKQNKELSVNNIELIPENAPQLSDLFLDREEGPHQEFKSAETCLVCHKQEMNIPGIGKVPKIPHLEKDNCLECHKLP